MPGPDALLAFAGASLLLVVIPGPNVVFIVTRGVVHGRAVAVASTLGVETGMLVHIAAAATGLSALVTRTALTVTAVKVVGAAYLLLLAVRAVRRRPTVDGEGQVAGDGAVGIVAPGLRRSFGQGFLISALNPKVAVFFLAFLPQFVRPGAGPVLAQTLVLGGVFVAIATASDLAYALVAGSARRPRWSGRRWARHGRYAEAAVYAGLGVTVLVTGTSD